MAKRLAEVDHLPLWVAALGFLGLNLLLRWPALPQSVLDVDESIYLLVSRSLLAGEMPYVAVWDHKPPGLYALFALAQLLFGQSVLAIRLLALLAVTLSCTLLFRFGQKGLGSGAAGLLAGLFYATFSLQNGGYATNTEILFAPPVIAGFYLFWTQSGFFGQPARGGPWIWLLIGLSFGVAGQIKPVAFFDLLAVLLLALAGFWRREPREGASRALGSMGLILLGAALPLLLAAAIFALTGHFAAYWEANVAANLRYQAAAGIDWPVLRRALTSQLRHHFLLWIALPAAFALSMGGRRSRPELARNLAALGLWLACTALAASSTGRFYWHYFLQLLPPLCLIAALTVVEGATWAGMSGRKQGRRLLLAATALLLLISLATPIRASLRVLWYQSRGLAPLDGPAAVAAYVQQQAGENALIYVVDYEPVVYFLAGARLPTRYVLPEMLVEEGFGRFAGVEPLAELDAIMAQEPRYVILRPGAPDSSIYRKLGEYLKAHYTLEATVREIEIYRLAQVSDHGSRTE